jgi:hypothetical protein
VISWFQSLPFKFNLHRYTVVARDETIAAILRQKSKKKQAKMLAAAAEDVRLEMEPVMKIMESHHVEEHNGGAVQVESS